MKSYRDDTGVFHRTQAEAKASGHPFEPVDIPTAHQELVDFVNGLLGPAEETLPRMDFERPVIREQASATDYQNGDPTRVVLKSRDPMAQFTCRACGVVNHPAGGR